MNYPTSKQIKSTSNNTSVHEMYLPNHEVELDFVNESDKQEEFMLQQEVDLTPNVIVTCLFRNELFPEANFVSIIPKTNIITYELSITFWRHKWAGNKSIDKFIVNFLRSCKNKRIKLEHEAEDMEGFYLVAQIEAKPEMSLKQRLEQLSAELSYIFKTLK